jgi:hypothetical protein
MGIKCPQSDVFEIEEHRHCRVGIRSAHVVMWESVLQISPPRSEKMRENTGLRLTKHYFVLMGTRCALITNDET